jgi:hypothetical protein
MAGETVGQIQYELDLDDSKFKGKADQASSEVKTLGDSFKSAEAGSAIFAAGIAAAGAAVVAFGISSVKAYNDTEKANAQTEAVLKSTAKARIGVYEQVLVSTKQVANSTKGYGDEVKVAEAKLHDMENAFKSAKTHSEMSVISLDKQRAAVEKLHGQATHAAGVYKTVFNPEMQISAEYVQHLSAEFQKVSTYSDETIQSGENMLLTFTNVGKKVLPNATQALLDMSTAMGTDVTNTAIQLGKALNDPINGVTALRRVGVTLTDQQQKQIETLVKQNKLYDAQKIILNELSTEFGGSAAAQAATFSGQLTILSNNLNDVQEIIGKMIVDAVKPLVQSFNDLFNSLGGPQGVLTALQNMAMQALPMLQANLPIIIGMIAGGLAPALFAAATATWAILWPWLQFVAAGAIIGLLIQQIVIGMGGWEAIMVQIQPIFDTLVMIFQNFIIPQLTAIWIQISTQLLPALTELWNVLAPILIPVLQALGVLLGVTLLGAFYVFIEGLKALITWITYWVTIIKNAVQAIFGFFTWLYEVLIGHSIIPDMILAIYEWFLKLPGMLAKALIEVHVKAIEGFIMIWGAIVGEVSQWPGRMFTWGQNIMNSFADGIKSALGSIAAAFKEGMDKAKSMVEGHSPPLEGPFKDIDKWGFNIGSSWVDGFYQAFNSISIPNVMGPGVSGVGVGAAGGGGNSTNQNITVNIGKIGDQQDIQALGREFGFRAGIQPA